ncbi:hypothetical protein LIER_10598 [Lithospermum erythrorhizon]|uniref:Uncharacterized protein n=1 Tax=Lithospermum erythrorhizon TaxID=34254 RepID=A0AAV3PPW5_LITER
MGWKSKKPTKQSPRNNGERTKTPQSTDKTVSPWAERVRNLTKETIKRTPRKSMRRIEVSGNSSQQKAKLILNPYGEAVNSRGEETRKPFTGEADSILFIEWGYHTISPETCEEEKKQQCEQSKKQIDDNVEIIYIPSQEENEKKNVEAEAENIHQ